MKTVWGKTNPDTPGEKSPKKQECPLDHSSLCLSAPGISLLQAPQTKTLFGFYPRLWPVNHKVPYFPWKWENGQLLDTTGRIIGGSTWGLRYL